MVELHADIHDDPASIGEDAMQDDEITGTRRREDERDNRVLDMLDRTVGDRFEALRGEIHGLRMSIDAANKRMSFLLTVAILALVSLVGAQLYVSVGGVTISTSGAEPLPVVPVQELGE